MEDLNLLESDYFGIQYEDSEGNNVFLDPLKQIKTQIKSTTFECHFPCVAANVK